ncbi:MAG: hypothetical protein ACLR2E_13660 [Lachnospiraceae bacterium]
MSSRGGSPPERQGKQKLPENCPHFCESYTYLYPEHLAMAGRYNSLFALDREILKNRSIWRLIGSRAWTGW